ncbi:DUF3793 family protein [Geobacter sp. DSM 9736]|uniref:DUF3793 family protein n=1 Tax=Geobacter sp. DSM 9736 TaxID=1277350 RepID=UPI002100C1B0|nr:DUF3793 family protein [Geobacter sp. DSM 9736]
MEAAEVLEGAKPANLVNVVSRRRPCGRNLYELWKKHGSNILQQSGLEVGELVDRGDSVLLFLYRSDALRSLLALKSVGTILLKAGYASY